jgi:hypothetical protein
MNLCSELLVGRNNNNSKAGDPESSSSKPNAASYRRRPSNPTEKPDECVRAKRAQKLAAVRHQRPMPTSLPRGANNRLSRNTRTSFDNARGIDRCTRGALTIFALASLAPA